MLERKELDFSSLPKAIQGMSEGDTNAAAIIDELIALKGESRTLATLILLDDMNIRGIQIYQLYKLSNKNIDKFYNNIINMKEEDLLNLNVLCAPVCAFKALFSGNIHERKEKSEKYLFTNDEREKYTKIVKEKNENLKDFNPCINTKDALKIIDDNGFILGYEKTYKNNENKKITYRVFYNEYKDIIYTHSLENIFLWGASKLNAVRESKNINCKKNPCNAYYNVPSVVGYNIELKQHPFKTYKSIIQNNEKHIENIQKNYYDNNLFPIIETVTSMKYKEEYPSYKTCVVASIYDLLTFNETYKNLDAGLKKIYKPLLDSASDKAYDEIISHLNSDEGIEIAIDLQNILGISLDKTKLFMAKDRYCEKNGHEVVFSETKFISKLISDNPWTKDINKRIIKILGHEIEPVHKG